MPSRTRLSRRACEWQNDPPDEDDIQTSGLTAHLIQTRVNGYPKGIIPPGCEALTAFIDVGKYFCFWDVVAWQAGAKGCIIDYGVIATHADKDDHHEALEIATNRALHEWREETLAEPYADAKGQPRGLDLCLVDSGWAETQDAVYAFVSESGGEVYRAAKGFGTGSQQPSWHSPRRKNKTIRAIGENWYIARQPNGINLVHTHADHWKGFVHERFLTPADRPGSLSLFGDEESIRNHLTFAKHITAEEVQNTFQRGKGVVKKWVKLRRANHWLDGVAGCCAAADILGVRLIGARRPRAGGRRGRRR